MRESIKKLLYQCIYACPDSYDEATHTFHIPKYTKPQFKVNKCYLIKVSQQVLKNPNSVTAVNWNKGAAPQFEYLKIYIKSTLGPMLLCDCAGYDFEKKTDINYLWTGWLNTTEITYISAL